MSNVTQQSEMNIQINVLEERVSELKKKVEAFDTIKDVLIELKLLTSQQIEANAQRDEMLKEHGIALAKAMGTLEDLVKKSDKHEIILENLNKKGNIPLGEVGKHILFLVIGAVVTALLSGIIIK